MFVSYNIGDTIEVTTPSGENEFVVIAKRVPFVKDSDDLPGWHGWSVRDPHAPAIDFNVFPPNVWGYDKEVVRVVRTASAFSS